MNDAGRVLKIGAKIFVHQIQKTSAYVQFNKPTHPIIQVIEIGLNS